MSTNTSQQVSNEVNQQSSGPVPVQHDEHSSERLAGYSRYLNVLLKNSDKVMAVARPTAFASEGAEAFRKIAPKLIVPLYGLSIGYVLADTANQTYKYSLTNQDRTKISLKCADTLMWHTIASMVVPGVVVNRTVHYSTIGLNKFKAPPACVKWLPPVLAIATLAAGYEKLDHFGDYVMDSTVRKLYKF
jgi:fission process protein 1